MKYLLSSAVVIFSILHLIHFANHFVKTQHISRRNESFTTSSTAFAVVSNHTNVEDGLVTQLTATSPTTLSHQNNNSNSNRVYPKIQVGLTTSANGLPYAMRFWANAIHTGWHQDFEDIPIFTFDPIPANGPLSKLFTRIEPLFPEEKLKKDNNLLVASIEAIYNHNPYADWYILAEDDTILIKENLLFAIKDLKLDPNKEFFSGNCGTAPTRGINGTRLPVLFVIGGSGIVMSKATVKALVPNIPMCRRTCNAIMYGDQRIGACLQYFMNRTLTEEKVCQLGWRFNMMNRQIPKAMELWSHLKVKGNQRIIAMHEKDPDKIQVLNEWVRARDASEITLKNMADDKRLVELVNTTESE